MAFIEGVGDEVTLFFVAVICGFVTLLAWWSTGNTNNYTQRIRTIIIPDRNVRYLYRIITRHANSTDTRTPQAIEENNTNPAPVVQQQQDPESEEEVLEAPTVRPIFDDDLPRVRHMSVNDNIEALAARAAANEEASIQDTEMNNIVNAMDTDATVLRNRRLAFFQSPLPLGATSSSKDNSDSNISSSDTQTNETEREDSETGSEPDSKCDGDTDSVNSSEKAKDSIRVRLKFLNDDLKEVEGSLQEQVGEFKRRHFQGELSARKLVRLIFNGQVLQREGATLESCGLFDNCVVHCLVHQPRTASQFAQAQQQLGASAINNENVGNEIPQQLMDHLNVNMIPPININNTEEREWDLSHVLLTMLASILSIAWYCHIRFSSLFGLAASIAMLALTTIYLMAVICVYFPDTNSNNTNNNTVNAAPPPTPQASNNANNEAAQEVNVES